MHVGRQPIFDRTGDVVAYELLFRGSMDAVEAGRRDTYATSQVVLPFGPEQVVLEVQETITVDDEVVAACRAYPGIQILAAGLETTAHLALSNRYGFELRQGYVLSRPQVLTATDPRPAVRGSGIGDRSFS